MTTKSYLRNLLPRTCVGYGVSGGQNPMTLEEVEQMPDAEARKLYDALLMLVDAGFIRVDKARWAAA